MTDNMSVDKIPKKENIIIITDLDGTLLDSAYSFEKAIAALKLVADKGIPLIFCSSKTRPEIEQLRRKLANVHPFVSENGGGIFIPKNSILNPSRFVSDPKIKITEETDYYVVSLGADYTDLRKALCLLRDKGFDLKGFGDMTVGEVSGLTGLDMESAELAKMREFDETFILNGDALEVEDLKDSITSMGFNYTQGEYFHIMGDSDKGRAVDILKSLYSADGRKVTVVALGDSPNDIEMLQRADYPVVVKKKNDSYHPQIISKVKECIKADGIGPEGWNKAVLELINKLFCN